MGGQAVNTLDRAVDLAVAFVVEAAYYVMIAAFTVALFVAVGWRKPHDISRPIDRR